MASETRTLHQIPGGDRWLLVRDPDTGRGFVRHEANPSSGGHVTETEVAAFLAAGGGGPEHQELRRLIGTLDDAPPATRPAATRSPPLAGGCQCGAVRYELTAEPSRTYVCHCRECQRQSASAFGISLIVPRGALRVTEGEPGIWARRTDGGRTLDCAFCPTCGSRLWHEDASSDEVSVKGGSLDRSPDLTGAVHIWTSRQLPGVVIPDGAARFAEEPPG